ncbi:MAG: DUF2127 domain-containing protein [Deltaproteobacteria bacterium]|nr:DUF2127 domain-containing protein [Deltaproteobacteria bacterium]
MSVGQRRTIRVVALIEAFKGGVVILAATGLLSLVHEDLPAIAEKLVAHAHLNPAAEVPRVFIEAAGHVQSSSLVLLALGAAAYSLLRLAEAYGLWHERAWAEVLAAVSGALYVPIELVDLFPRPNWLGSTLLAVNLVIVVIMVRALAQRRRTRSSNAL